MTFPSVEEIARAMADDFLWPEAFAKMGEPERNIWLQHAAAARALFPAPPAGDDVWLLKEALAELAAARRFIVKAVEANVSVPDFKPEEHVRVVAIDAVLSRARTHNGEK